MAKKKNNDEYNPFGEPNYGTMTSNIEETHNALFPYQTPPKYLYRECTKAVTSSYKNWVKAVSKEKKDGKRK
jgi:hypothetical protein